MKISPDFSESVDQEVIPVGEYPVVVKGVDPKVSKAGNDMLLWKYEIQGAAGEYEKFNGRWIFDNTMTSGRGAFRLKATLKAILGESREFDTEEVLGRQVRVVVSHGVDLQGALRAEVKSVSAIS